MNVFIFLVFAFFVWIAMVNSLWVPALLKILDMAKTIKRDIQEGINAR